MDGYCRKNPMNVIFFGNHTVGVSVLKVLLKEVNVEGVVSHPSDPEDFIKYESVYDFSLSNNLNAIRGKGSDKKIVNFVTTKSPDLIWVTDYRYLLPKKIFTVPKYGSINMHPSLLPKYRGRASLNWAIINGEKKIGLTAHFIDEHTDNGDIILQKKVNINENEDINDALNKLYPLYRDLTKKVIFLLKKGNVKRIPQDGSKATYFPSRKPEDGLINWSDSAKNIFNLVRALSKPYPGAFSYYNKVKVLIWKSEVLQDLKSDKFTIGSIVKYQKKNMFIVKCGKDLLKITEWSVNQDSSFEPRSGNQFRSY